MSVFCLHRFALSTNPRIIPAEISRYRLLSMSVSLISRQPMKLQISFGFARAMPTTNPRTGMLWERDCYYPRKLPCACYGDDFSLEEKWKSLFWAVQTVITPPAVGEAEF